MGDIPVEFRDAFAQLRSSLSLASIVLVLLLTSLINHVVKINLQYRVSLLAIEN